MSQSDVLGQNIVYVVAVLSCVHLSNLMWTYITEKKGKGKGNDQGSRLTLVMTLPAKSSQFSLLYPGT